MSGSVQTVIQESISEDKIGEIKSQIIEEVKGEIEQMMTPLLDDKSVYITNEIMKYNEDRFKEINKRIGEVVQRSDVLWNK